jgi:hypothetical protein
MTAHDMIAAGRRHSRADSLQRRCSAGRVQQPGETCYGRQPYGPAVRALMRRLRDAGFGY